MHKDYLDFDGGDQTENPRLYVALNYKGNYFRPGHRSMTECTLLLDALPLLLFSATHACRRRTERIRVPTDIEQQMPREGYQVVLSPTVYEVGDRGDGKQQLLISVASEEV